MRRDLEPLSGRPRQDLVIAVEILPLAGRARPAIGDVDGDAFARLERSRPLPGSPGAATIGDKAERSTRTISA